eukprot:457602_1
MSLFSFFVVVLVLVANGDDNKCQMDGATMWRCTKMTDSSSGSAVITYDWMCCLPASQHCGKYAGSDKTASKDISGITVDKGTSWFNNQKWGSCGSHTLCHFSIDTSVSSSFQKVEPCSEEAHKKKQKKWPDIIKKKTTLSKTPTLDEWLTDVSSVDILGITAKEAKGGFKTPVWVVDGDVLPPLKRMEVYDGSKIEFLMSKYEEAKGVPAIKEYKGKTLKSGGTGWQRHVGLEIDGKWTALRDITVKGGKIYQKGGTEYKGKDLTYEGGQVIYKSGSTAHMEYYNKDNRGSRQKSQNLYQYPGAPIDYYSYNNNNSSIMIESLLIVCGIILLCIVCLIMACIV